MGKAKVLRLNKYVNWKKNNKNIFYCLVYDNKIVVHDI